MVINRQRRIRVSAPALGRFLARAGRALALNGHGCAVCLVTEAEMARLNRTYRGKRGPTDVLSFPTGCGPVKWRTSVPADAPFLGDIAVSPAVARRNARRLGRSLDEELRILILHGVLHLMGYDHETDNGRMDRVEHRMRRKLGLA